MRGYREPDRKRHRLAHEVYAGRHHGFSFTICASSERSPFIDDRLAEAVVRSLLFTRSKHQWLPFAYCLMPDHLHFVGRLTAPSRPASLGARSGSVEGVLEHVARFKSFTTREAWRLGYHGSLWQRSSYDRLIDDTNQLEETVRYVLENPVRAGLVTEWQDWPYAAVVDSL